MGGAISKELMRLMYKEIYEEKRDLFFSLGGQGRYSEAQKRFAFELIANGNFFCLFSHSLTSLYSNISPVSIVNKDIPRCFCGRERLPGHRFCTACAAERKRQRNKLYYHGKKDHHAETIKESTLKCKQCVGPRLPNHIYCSKCAKHRKTMTRRQAQSRYWRKRQDVMV